MKKILLAVLVSLGLQTQAQQNYCDSITYTTSPSQTLTVIGDAGSLSNMVDSIDWVWQACNSTMCYSVNGTTATFLNILSTDTVKVCYDAYIYMDSSIYICTHCDSLVYNANSYSWVVFSMNNPTSINELTLDKINNNKMYDMLGRELIEAPRGVMYIRNNRLYITK